MSKATKLALILVIAGITMAATRLMPVKDEAATARAVPRLSISPAEIMRSAAPMNETKVDDYL
jgi:hypothetical protein